MTTIVVYKNWIAADRRYSDGDSILTDHCDKIITRPDGIIIAGAGDGAQSWAMMHSSETFWNWGDMGPEFPLEWVKDKSMLRRVQLLLHRPGDKCVYLTSETRWCDPLPMNREMVAIGSGSHFARAACRVLEHETDYPPKVIVRKAVEYAIELDPNSGGEVQLVRLSGLSKPQQR